MMHLPDLRYSRSPDLRYSRSPDLRYPRSCRASRRRMRHRPRTIKSNGGFELLKTARR
jgi:hypothetical protein